MISNPIIVISYNDDIRRALLDNLQRNNAGGVVCETFLQAEDVAREGIYNGILVDLQSIVKAKGEEKIIACSLTGFYPTLRVRALGAMLVPMAMPGDAKQDSSIADFINKSCLAFKPRRLRMHRRRDITLSACITSDGSDRSSNRLVTLNVSWGGAFFMDAYPENYEVGREITIMLPEFEHLVTCVVCWVRPWGTRKVPGFGVAFTKIDERLESILAMLMQHERTNDRDRMIAR